MARKVRIYCVTAYNKYDLESAQERGRIAKHHTPTKSTYISSDGKKAKYKKPSLGFMGQRAFYFLYKPDANEKEKELKMEYDVVKIKKCKLRL